MELLELLIFFFFGPQCNGCFAAMKKSSGVSCSHVIGQRLDTSKDDRYLEPVTCIEAEKKKKTKLELGLFCVFLGVAPLGCGFLRCLLELCLMREDGTGMATLFLWWLRLLVPVRECTER